MVGPPYTRFVARFQFQVRRRACQCVNRPISTLQLLNPAPSPNTGLRIPVGGQLHHAPECLEGFDPLPQREESFASLEPGLVLQIRRRPEIDDRSEIVERLFQVPERPCPAAELECAGADPEPG